jgi:hypothetical protein
MHVRTDVGCAAPRASSAVAGVLWSAQDKRERERERVCTLLFYLVELYTSASHRPHTARRPQSQLTLYP